MTDFEDLKFMPRELVMMTLAADTEKIKGRLQVLELILQMFDGKDLPPPDDTAAKHLKHAREMVPTMQRDLLLATSIIHWLQKERT